MRRFLFLISISFLATLTACEKEVQLDLTDGETQLVVNGQIETGVQPFVILTRSIGYFSKVDLKTLENSFEHNAVITVSDGTRSIKLREYSADTGGIAKFYGYTIDTADASSFSFVGVPGRYYMLTIVTTSGKTYTSTAKIPIVKPIDSLTAAAPNPLPKTAPTAMRLNVHYSDPDTVGNYIRYFTQRNSEPFYPGLNSVLDDQIINGTKGGVYPITPGTGDPNINFNDSTGYVFRGDTVTLKWAAIDKGAYDFYQTLDYSLGTVGNPFSSPINVLSNISGGALGVWVGYGSSLTTIVVPK